MQDRTVYLLIPLPHLPQIINVELWFNIFLPVKGNKGNLQKGEKGVYYFRTKAYQSHYAQHWIKTLFPYRFVCSWTVDRNRLLVLLSCSVYPANRPCNSANMFLSTFNHFRQSLCKVYMTYCLEIFYFRMKVLVCN